MFVKRLSSHRRPHHDRPGLLELINCKAGYRMIAALTHIPHTLQLPSLRAHRQSSAAAASREPRV